VAAVRVAAVPALEMVGLGEYEVRTFIVEVLGAQILGWKVCLLCATARVG